MNKIVIINIIYIPIFLLITRHIYRMKMRERMNTYFELKLKILRQEYLEAKEKGKFKEYPLIEKEILNTLKLIDNGEFDLRKVKIFKKRKIFEWDDKALEKSKNYSNELKTCNSTMALKCESEMQILKDEIIRYRYPMRIFLDKILLPLELYFMMVLLFVLNVRLFIHKHLGKKNRMEIKDSEKKIKDFKASYYTRKMVLRLKS